MISLKNISKSFHKKSVLCDVSFQISEHSITTLVGPNGIGKTTLLNILCGVLYPDSGIVTCENADFRKDMFTVLSGSQHLYAKNTVKENIIFLSVLRGRSTAEIAENLEKYRSWFPLYETVQSRLFEELSTGQKQMMLILAALVADARYLLLDEPTEGLDLNHKQMLTDLVIYTLLLCFFFASNTGHTFAQEYGDSNYKALLLLGYIAWSFSSAAVSAISSLLLMELQRGTLFFKLNPKMPLQFLYLGDLASAVCIQTFVILLYSAITHFIFGVNYSVNGTIIAALFICTLGMYGIGLIIAGLSLYYKRIGSIVLLVQLFLLFVTDTLPTSSAIRQITQVIPLTACNRVVRNSYVKDSAGTDFLLLCVYSAVWFLIGYAVFEIFIRRAKEKGNLLLY